MATTLRALNVAGELLACALILVGGMALVGFASLHRRHPHGEHL